MRSSYRLVAAASAIFLLLLPLPSQLRLRNFTIIIAIASQLFLCIIYFVNIVVWAGNVEDVAPIWCDISTNIWFYCHFAAECSVFCIAKHLECITSSRNNASSKHNRLVFEVVVSLIVPLFSIPLRYALSTNRYMILEDSGCYPAFHPSKVATALIYGIQILITVSISGIAAKATFNLFRTRYATTSLTSSAITFSLFFRFIIICIIVGPWGTIICSVALYHSLSLTLFPWPGWVAVHKHFTQILLIPLIEQLPNSRKMLSFRFVSYIVTSYIIVVVLLCSEDVRHDYRRAWAWVRPKLVWSRRDVSLEMNVQAPSKPQVSTEILTIVIESSQKEGDVAT